MKNLRVCVVVFFLFLSLVIGINNSAVANEYLVGPGDVLYISVWGHDELATQVTVRPDGYLTFPLVGDHWAVDKTTRELRTELETILAEFVVNPQVTVMVREFRTLEVQVLGEVKNSGYYTLKAGSRLMDVLALAGGPSKTADLNQVTITRYSLDSSGQEYTNVLQVDVNDYIQYGNLNNNPLIESGDMIYVAPSGRATIFGEVRQPTSYDLGSGLDILDLLALAEGALDSADLTQVIVTFQTEAGPQDKLVNVQEILSGRARPVNIQANDVVFVPKQQQVMVLGAVQNPGTYSMPKELNLVDLLSRAGGVLATANTESISITRRLGDKQELMVVDATASLTGREGGDNPPLRADDLIFVPEGYQNVLVLGEVRVPGSYLAKEQTRLLDVLAQAGGTSDRSGETLILTRNGETKEVELGALQRLGLQNERVLPGDVIYVPEGRREVLILGEVRNPGYVHFRQGDRLIDAIGLAGGLTESAFEEEVSLSRQTEQGTEISIIDFSELMENRYLADNKSLQAGDVIIVPRSNRSTLVLGEVREPGYYVFSKGQRFMDLIGIAGGFTADADPEKVVITRETPTGVEIETVNLDLLAGTVDNGTLQGGEIISVPKANRTVLVFGEVDRPGAYSLPPQGRLLDILALSGGIKTNTGEETVVLTRELAEGEQVWQVNQKELMTSQSEYNLSMLGGDVIYVPAAHRQILVLGQVKNPGVYTLPAGARVMDALAMAGGPLERAALEAVGIYRDGSMDGSELVAMGKDKVLFSGDASENPLLDAGDIVYVPETKKPDWTKIFGFLGGLKTFKDLFNIRIPW